MNNKNIIIAGAIAVGLYLFSQMKKTAQRIRPTATPTIRQRTAQKVAQKIAQKVDISKWSVQQIRDMIAHAAAQKKTGKEVAALRTEEARRVAAWKAAQKKVASWKAPYKSPNSKFRVITPSDLLKNIAKKDISQKKAIEQEKVQKTTPSTPSDREKSRLEALYGSHWRDVWRKRQKRR